MNKIILLTAAVVFLSGCTNNTVPSEEHGVDLGMNENTPNTENAQVNETDRENSLEEEVLAILDKVLNKESNSTQDNNVESAESENTEPSGDDNSQSAAEPAPSADTAPAAEADNTQTDSSIGEFDSLNLSISKGSLYVRTGSEFEVTEKGGGKATYHVSNGILYFENDSRREFILTLPYDSFEDITLNANDGHIYVESSLSAKTLNLTIRKGEVSIADINISDNSNIDAKEGGGSLNGDFGQNLTAGIENGKLALKLAYEKNSYNYNISVYQGNVNIGSSNYHNRSDSWTIDNGADRNVSLNANRGDISVQF